MKPFAVFLDCAFGVVWRHRPKITAFKSILVVGSTLLSSCSLVTSTDGLADDPPAETGGAGAAGIAGSAGGGTGGASGTGAGGTGATTGGAGAGAGGSMAGSAGAGGCAQPCVIELAEGRSNPLGITANSTHVYWVERGTAGIYRVGIDGGDPERVDDFSDGFSDGYDVAVDETYLYWSQRETGNMYKRPLGGGPVTLEYTVFCGKAAYLAVRAGLMAATDNRDAADTIGLGTVVYGGEIVSAVEERAQGISILGDQVFWIRGTGTLATANITMVPNPTITDWTTLAGASAISVIDDQVFWLRDNQALVETMLSSGQTSTLVDNGLSFGSGDVVATANAVYWTESTNGRVRKLKR